MNGASSAPMNDVVLDGVRMRIIGTREADNRKILRQRLARFLSKILAARILEEAGDAEAANRIWE